MRQLSIAAAQIATLATLSGGRFKLGVGIGGEWPREWQAAGVSIYVLMAAILLWRPEGLFRR